MNDLSKLPFRVSHRVLLAMLIVAGSMSWYLFHRVDPGLVTQAGPAADVAKETAPVVPAAPLPGQMAGKVKFVGGRKAKLPDLDVRSAKPLTPVRPERTAALEVLRVTVPGVKVEFDPLTGAPASMMAMTRLLTPPVEGKVNPRQIVEQFVAAHAPLFGHDAKELSAARVSRDDVTAHNGMTTLVWNQQLDGVPLFKAVFRASVTRRGEIISLGDQFLPNPEQASGISKAERVAMLSGPVINPAQAISSAAASVNTEVPIAGIAPQGAADGAERRQRHTAQGLSDVSAGLTWMPMDADSVRLGWDVTLFSLAQNEMFRCVVDAESGIVLYRQSLTNDVTDASYRVFLTESPTPMSPGLETPSSYQAPAVNRTLFTTKALNLVASPKGWINDGDNETNGNNVDAHTDSDADNLPDLPRPSGSPARVFDFPIDLTQAPSTYKPASVTQLFYWCNFTHDKLYELGFTESAGNFQLNNFGRGGLGGDAVQADAQDGSGTDNANFSTPADGGAGRMQMYLWTGPIPDRDGSFEAEVVVHEYCHGLSNRLVGGGVGISALASRGMGEGWSDFYGLAMTAEASDNPHGNWARGAWSRYLTSTGYSENYYYGARRYSYSTDVLKNPHTYKDIDPTQVDWHTNVPRNPTYAATQDATEVHYTGTVWCTMLWELRASLILKHGFDVGNTLCLQLVTDGLKLTPVNPTFVQARDGIVLAELVNTGGANAGEVWAAFAKRGMGADATAPASGTTTGVRESYSVPDGLEINDRNGWNINGTRGGLFAPGAKSVVISNDSATPFSWSVNTHASWLNASPASGTLAPGAQTTVTFTTNAADVLTGFHSTSVAFTNTTTGFRQPVDVRLYVAAPAAYSFNLDTNPGWTTTGLWTYGTPTGSGGTLSGGTGSPDPTSGATGAKVFGVNLAGNYTGGVSGPFYLTTTALDLSNRVGTRLRFKRWLNTPSISSNRSTVEVSTDGTTWKEVFVSPGSAITSTSWSTIEYDLSPIADKQAAVYLRWGYQNLTTSAYSGWNIDDIEVLGEVAHEFTLALASSATEGDAPLSATLSVTPTPVSDLVVNLSSSLPSQASVPATVTIPGGSSTVSFNVAINDDTLFDGPQTVTISASTTGYSTLQQKLVVQDNESPPLVLTAPATVSEGALNATATLRLPSAAGADVVIALTSGNEAIAVPANVTLPAGQTSVSVPLSVLNDTVINGDRGVALTASVEGWATASASITVTDDETSALAVVAPSVVSEPDGVRTGAGAVTLSGTYPTSLTIILSSSDTTALAVPASVTIPAGSTSASFDITVINDALQDGPQTSVITASVADFTSGTATVVVNDDESVPAPYAPSPAHLAAGVNPDSDLSWSSGAGNQITNGDFETGTFAGWTITPALNTTFKMQGGNVDPVGTDTAFLPYAGAWSAMINVSNSSIGWTMSQDFVVPADGGVPLLEWTQRIRNTTTAYSATVNFRVELRDPATDAVLATLFTTQAGDPLFMDWAARSADLTAWRGQTVRLTFYCNSTSLTAAIDNVRLLGSPAATTYDVYLGTSPTLGAGDLLGNSANRSWSLPRLTRGGVYYWQVVSKQGAASTTGPVWQFNVAPVGAPASYEWSNISSPQQPGMQFASVLTARDAFGDLASGFNGTTSLEAVPASNAPGGILITEIDPATDTAEFTNISGVAVDFSGWTATFYDSNASPLPSGEIIFPSGSVAPASGVFTVKELGTKAGTYPAFFLSGVNLNWNTGASRIAVLLRNDRGDIVDFVSIGGATTPDQITVPVSIPASQWAGSYAPSTASSTATYQRTGTSDRNSATDWSAVATGSVGTLNTGLVLPFSSGSNVRISPAMTGSFVNGVWSGSVSVLDPVTSVQLRAHGPGSAQGSSNAFTVTSLGALSMTAAASVNESAGTVVNFGTVTLPSPQASPVTVTFALSDASQASIASVTIPAGSTSAPYALTAVNDTLLEGTMTLRIEASAAGFTSASAVATLLDDETASITVALPASRAENLPPSLGAGLVTLSAAPSRAVTINLTSSDTTELVVPATVTIPAGSTSCTFDLTMVDDSATDGPQNVTVTASTAGFTDGSASITITDNESPVLTLALAGSAAEASGVLNGTLSLSSATNVPLTFTLNSTDPTAASVPASVTIPAGQSSVMVPVTIVDDALMDGAQTTTISASAVGFVTASSTLTVTDNDLHHFAISTIANPQVKGRPFAITITAKTFDNATVAGFAGTASLTGSGVTPATTGAFTAGIWSGNVTINTLAASTAITVTSGAATGIGNTFAVSFGALDHFSLGTITSPKSTGIPFSTTITALDAQNNTVADYAGAAQLRMLGVSQDSVIGSGGNSHGAMFPDGEYARRSQIVLPAAQIGGAGRITAMSVFVTYPSTRPINALTLRMRHYSPQTLTTSAWETTGWTTTYAASTTFGSVGWTTITFTTPFDYNGTDAIMLDFVARRTLPEVDNLQLACISTSTPLLMMYADTSTAGVDPLTWSGSSPAATIIGTAPLVKLSRLPVLPISPSTTGGFASGVWTGNVRAMSAAPAAAVLASDNGITGASNTFTVNASSGALGITLSSSANENAGSISGTVTLPAASGSATTINLQSSSTSDATVPATVSIPAGSTSASFTVTLVDDTIIEGLENVSVEAWAANYTSAMANIAVNDDDAGALALSVSGSLMENGATATGTVSLAGPAQNAVTVALTSNDLTEATVPASVVIQAGQSSANFAVTPVNDVQLDGPINVTITATSAGFGNGTLVVVVNDDESAQLLGMPATSVFENAGTVSFSMALSASTPVDRVITLTSSDPSLISVPPSVTITAGNVGASYSGTITDDALQNGTRTVTITASSPGLLPVSSVITVNDNELHHFSFSMPSQVITTPSTLVFVSAMNISNVLLTSYPFSPTPTFTASNASGSVPVTATPGSIVSGQRTYTFVFPQEASGVTLTGVGENGVTGTSNVFDVVSSGALDHLALAGPGSSQTLDAPFNLTVTAQDSANRTVTDFNATVALSASVSSSTTSGSGTSTWGFPLYTFYHDARTQLIYTPSEVGGARRLTSLALNVSSTPGQTMNAWTIRLKHTTKADYASSAVWDSTGWTTVYQANETISTTGLRTFTFATPFDYDGTSNLMVDFSFNNSSFTSEGFVTYTTAASARALYAYTDSGYGDPLTWSNSTAGPFTSTNLPNITFGSIIPVTMEPASAGTFVNGVWSGPVVMRALATGVRIYAITAGIAAAQSTAFNVVPAGTLSVSIPTLVEGGGAVSATVTSSVVMASDTVVTLTNLDPSETVLPASVTILAGQTSATFSIAPFDDAELDGTQSAPFTLSAPGYATTTANANVLDDETATLAVALPASTIEGAGTLTARGQVTLSAPASAPLRVTLTSSDTTELTVPTTVTVPAGATSATFDLTVVDDALLDFAQNVTVSASVANWTGGSANIVVNDNDAVFTFSGTTSVTESSTVTTGTVTIPSALPDPLTITINANGSDEITLGSSTVTIAAGSTSTTFSFTPVNDTDLDGSQTAILTFSAPGFVSGQRILTVADNDAHHYTISSLSSPRAKNEAISFLVTARDVNDATITTTASLTVTANNSSGSVPVTISPSTPALTNVSSVSCTATFASVSDSVVLRAQDANGRFGLSNAIDIIGAGPVTKFLWSTQSSRPTETPTSATITAADAGNNPVPGYSGPVSIGAFVAGTLQTIGTGTTTSSFPLAASNQDARCQMIYLASQVGAKKRLTAMDLSVATSSTTTLNNFTVRLKHTSATSTTSWDATGWTTVYQTNRSFSTTGFVTLTFTTPFDYDGTSNLMVDISFNNSSTGTSATCNYTSTSSTRMITGVSGSGNGDPLTWSGTTPTATASTNLSNIRFTNLTPLTVTPATSGAFSGGTWTGNITVRDPGTAVLLSAVDSTTGLFANSGTFNVTTGGTITLTSSGNRAENAGAVAGAMTLTLSVAPVSPLTVTLESNDPTEVVPTTTTVTIPAGNTTASISLTAVDDAILDGTQTATISASAPGYTRGSATIGIADNEGGVISVTLPASGVESDGTLTGTVTVTPATPSALTVTLASNDITELTVPASVTISAGATSASFTATLVNDALVDGTQNTTVTASAANWTGGSATIAVLDDDAAPRVSVDTIGTFSEGSTMTAMISVPSAPASALTVNLSSSDTSVFTVPVTATINGGSTYTFVTLTAPENTTATGIRYAYLQASASGYLSSAGGGGVNDNDPASFAFSTIASPKIGGQPFTVTITPLDPTGNTLTSFTGTATLSAQNAGGGITVTPATTGSFFAGSWTGTIAVNAVRSGITLRAQDANGRFGTSNSFDTTSSTLDHFTFATVPSPQSVGTPFSTTVTARDAYENVVSSFTGSTELSAGKDVLNTTAGSGTNSDWYPFGGYYPQNRCQMIYLPSEIGASPRQLRALAFEMTTPSVSYPAVNLTNVTIRLKHTTKTSFSGSALWETDGWTTVFQGSLNMDRTGWRTIYFAAPFAYNGTDNLMVDVSSSKAALANRIEARCTSTSLRTIYGFTTQATPPTDWVGNTPSASMTGNLPNFRLLSYQPLISAPNQTGDFSAGSWSGNLTLFQSSGNAAIIASKTDDGTRGVSNTFAVNSLGMLTLSMPVSVSEGAAPQTGTLTISSAPGADLLVTLTSGNTSAATVPSSIMIPAGQTSVTFSVTPVDDVLVDGAQTTNITATATGYDVAVAPLTVTDNEANTITVTLPPSVAENAGTLTNQGMVTLAVAPDVPVVVSLTSNDTSELTVPAAVTVPAGSTSVTFSPVAVDDGLIDLTKTVTVTAAVAGWTSGSANLNVTDSDNATPLISYSNSTVAEGYGFILTATLAFPVSLENAQTFSLVSSNTSKVTVPATVTVAAGSKSATFYPTVLDDILMDGDQVVTITASAAGFASADGPFTVLDNDPHHFAVSSVATQVAGTAFSVTFTAKSSTDATLTGFSGSAALSAAAGSTPLTMTPGTTASFSSGSRTVSVTLTQAASGTTITALHSASGASGTSNAFDINAAGLHHLAIATIASPKSAQVPFNGNITAQDIYDNTVSSFSGTASLWASGPELQVGSGTGTTASVLGSSFDDNRCTLLFTAAELGGPARLRGLTIDVTTAPNATRTNFTIRLKHTALTSLNANWDATGWTTVYQGSLLTPTAGLWTLPFSGAFDFNGSSNLLIDISFNNTSSMTSGFVRSHTTTGSSMISGSSFSQNGDPLTWTGTTPTPIASTTRPNIRLLTENTSYAVTPATTGSFATGVWNGNITFAQPGLGLRLQAAVNGTVGSGQSNSFDVTAVAPVLANEPAFTGGTSNTINWSTLPAGYELLLERSTVEGFTSPVQSAWVTGTSLNQTGLSSGTGYYYRARSRINSPVVPQSWTQTSTADFQSGTLVSADTTTTAGSVKLSLNGFTETFEGGASDWSDTMFTDRMTGTYVKNAAPGTLPVTTPPLPISADADKEAEMSGLAARALMTQSAPYIMTDGSITAYILPRYTSGVSHSGVFLRASGSSSTLNGYQAMILYNPTLGAPVWTALVKYTSGAASNILFAGSGYALSPSSEHLKTQLSITGTTLTMKLWRVSVIGGVVTETLLETRTASDSSFGSGVAGLIADQGAVFDDVVVASSSYNSPGSITSPAIAPSSWSQWGILNFTLLTPTNTSGTVDVLSNAGTVLASAVASGTNLNSLPAVASQPSIKLRANFATTNLGVSPELQDWTLGYSFGGTSFVSPFSNVVMSIQDADAPVVTSTPPTIVTAAAYNLTGAASDAISGLSGVTVNGNAATSSDGYATWIHSLTLTPGVNPLNIIATDNALPANTGSLSRSILYATNSTDSDGDGLSDLYEVQNGLDALNNGGTDPDVGALGDPDHDGLCNLLEYAFNTSANTPTPNPCAASSVLNSGDGLPYLTFTYPRRIAAAGLIYTVQCSPDMSNGSWSSPLGQITEISATPNPDGLTETVTVRISPAISGTNPHRFVRVAVSTP